MGRRRRTVRKLLAALAAAIVLAAVGGYWYVRPLLLTGTGYAAHNDCAVRQIAGRQDPQTDLPPNPLVPYLRSASHERASTTTVLGLLSSQTAWYVDGFGCVVADERPGFVPSGAVSAQPNPFTQMPTPTMDGQVAAAVGQAFGDDLSPAERDRLGTRAVLVVRDGRIIGERYADGFTADTPQLGWSMAKSVTNLLTGRLVHEGRIGLQDTGLRPEWTDGRSAISVDQLIRMTSGLRWDETYDLGTPITEMLYLHPDMAGYAASQPLAHDPGSYQQYSSGSTNILCSVLAERVGAQDFPREWLFEPLGLSSAVWEPDGSGNPVCSSYLWATPRDWATIGQFALQDGTWNGNQLLPAGWMTQSTTAEAVPTDDPGYAAGWRSNSLPDGTLADPALPPDTYWASGHDGQRLYVVPSARLVVVRLGFSPQADDLRVSALLADLLR